MEYFQCHYSCPQPSSSIRAVGIPTPNTFGQQAFQHISLDVQFCTLAAANPQLCWNLRHSKLWLESLAVQTDTSSARTTRWSCTYCDSTYHFPDQCPHCPFVQTNKILALVLQDQEYSPACYNMHVMITHITGTNNSIAHFSFSDGPLQTTSSNCQSPCRPCSSLADPILSQLRESCQYLRIAPSTRHVYQSALNPSFYRFCEKYRIQPLSASNLTLQFFCVDATSLHPTRHYKYTLQLSE